MKSYWIALYTEIKNMENYKKYVPLIYKQKEKLKDSFFSGTKLYGVISNG